MYTHCLRSILTLVVAIYCFNNSSSAQSNYRFRNYTINDGLSQSSVLCVLQDNTQAIWVGTQDGINRFDGNKFEVFTADETEGLSSSYAKAAIKGPFGNLWFGTVNGLVKYNTKTEQFQSFGVGSKEVLHIESLSFDQSGKIWIASSTRGILLFDPKTEQFQTKLELFPTRKTKSILVLKSGKIACFSEDLGLQITDIQRKKVEDISLKDNFGNPLVVIGIHQMEKGKILLGTNQGIYEYDVNKKELKKLFRELDQEYGSINVTAIIKNNYGDWFLGTKKKGLFVIDENGSISNSTQDIFQKNALLYNEINCLFKDQSGTFWIGSGRGLSSFDPNNQGFLGIGPSGNLQHGIPTPTVWCFDEDFDSRYVYIGTDAGVTRMDRKSGKFRQFYRQASEAVSFGDGRETAVLGMHLISPNHILIGCVDGFYELKISGNSYQFIPFIDKNNPGIFERSYKIHPFKEEKYFVATKAGVVLVDLKKHKTQVFKHNPSKPQSSLRSGICRFIYKDKSGDFWFTTSSGGLNKLKTKGDSLYILPYEYNSIILDSLPEYITSIHETKKGEFYLGTLGGGLAIWNPKRKEIEKLTKDNGLPNNVVYGVIEDDRGHIWCSTNRGLAEFNPSTESFINYSEIHGLMSNEFNSGAYFKSKSGHLYFGGIYGFNYFKPSSLSNFNREVDVRFTKFKLDNEWLKPLQKGSPLIKPLSETKELLLDYNQRSFTIAFQPTNLSNPELVNYKYELVGAEEGEIYIGNTNELRFNALSSGEYILKVYARIGEGPWLSSPEIIHITIATPFWKKWWFWLALAAFIAIAVRIAVRKRIEYERREQVRLEIKIAERTREIRAQNIQIERQKKALEKEKEKVEKQSQLLAIEKEKSEKLLRNVIPESMANELLEKGKASARSFKTVSVLFTDFVGFTKIADNMDPSRLVQKLDVFFRKFDEIILANNLEKIKTIGDAYMCAGGVPVRNNTNPIDTCLAGLQIQHYMKTLDQTDVEDDFLRWKLRLGINTGEVTAGAIGRERLAYDVWGATVNQAQRMEMMGEPGKVTITGNTFLHIEPYFECVYKGKVQTKSRGEIDMYQVLRIKPELSVNGEGIYPNERFHQIVNLHHYSSINYYRAERHIMQILKDGLSDKLHYHSIDHMQDVVDAVERLALSEDVTDEGLFLLKTAATYHDAGFVEQYDKNEPIGARMAEEILPKYGYTQEHIDRIKELIYVTQIPHQPKNKLEEIICDADLDYLGRDDFHEIADRLRRELKEHGKIDSDRKWDEIQVSFLTMHQYFTKTAIETRQAKKEKHIQEVKDRLERGEYED